MIRGYRVFLAWVTDTGVKNTMESILVSAIITTHNRSELLDRAICSVKNQTYKNIELIVVDDASENLHREKNEVLAKGIKYHYIEESRGGNYARNMGIDLSSGNLIAFLDDDDVWHSTKIEKQVAMYKRTHFEVVGCARNIIFEKNGRTLISLPDLRKRTNGQDFSETIFLGAPFVSSQLMITRDALLNVGKFDITLKAWQDYDLLIRLSEKYIFGCVEEILVDYYVNLSDSNRLTNRLDVFLDSFPIIENKYKERILSLSPQNKKQWRKFYLIELANRASNKFERRRYRKEIFLMDMNVKDFIFYIFNINENSNALLLLHRWRKSQRGNKSG